MPTEQRTTKPRLVPGTSPVSHKVVKTLTFKGAKTKYQYMIKTLSSITLLLVASGWLSLLPAETKTKYVCIYCNKEFSSKTDEFRLCPNAPANRITIKSYHKFRTK
jgi:DNA-directed RNA polymerase subunit RPC12/RpoP